MSSNNNNTNINTENQEFTDWDKIIYKMIDAYLDKVIEMSEISKNTAYLNVCSTIDHHYKKGRLTINDKFKNYCDKLILNYK